MRPLSPRVRKVVNSDPFYRTCIRKGLDCKGRIEIDHAFIYGGRQVDEVWALVPQCHFHHVEDLDRPYSQYVALLRATEEGLKRYPKYDWNQLKTYLNTLYEKRP